MARPYTEKTSREPNQTGLVLDPLGTPRNTYRREMESGDLELSGENGLGQEALEGVVVGVCLQVARRRRPTCCLPSLETPKTTYNKDHS
jgi:hypothetical protein